MKRFFLLVGILASALINQSAFANDGTGTTGAKCLWVYGTGAHWTCATSAANSFNTGVSCTSDAWCTDHLGNQNPTTLNDCTPGVDCGKIPATASFDFNIQAGGARSNLYVCEAGFANRACENCGKNKIVFRAGPNKTVFTGGTTFSGFGVNSGWTFDYSDDVRSADLYINGVNEDSGFYVKYCLDIKRMLVLPEAPTANDIPHFTLSDSLTLTPGNGVHGNQMYFDATNLRTFVLKRCYPGVLSRVKGLPLLANSTDLNLATFQYFFEDIGNGSQTILDFLADITALSQTSSTNNAYCFQGHCEWTVLFKEMNKCIVRSLETCTGLDCVAREAKISTSLNANVDFCDAQGDCH